MSAIRSSKSPMNREGKKFLDCCEISQELVITLDKLRGDCGTLRAQDREFANILETLIFMDDSFKKQTEQKIKMKKEYASKFDTNKSSISTLRQQIDEQKISLIEKKMEHVEIITEFEETQSKTVEGGSEYQNLETSLISLKSNNESLVDSKKQLEEQLYQLRELNSNDICEINKLKYELDQSSKGINSMNIEEESQEQLIQIQMSKIESMENKLESKMVELDDKAYQLEENENEIVQYESQVDSFNQELDYLRSMEQKYTQENEDLHYRIQEE